MPKMAKTEKHPLTHNYERTLRVLHISTAAFNVADDSGAVGLDASAWATVSLLFDRGEAAIKRRHRECTAMEIAVLGWGSLIWSPRGLKLAGQWQPDGPRLPVEFARVSQDERLTLVLYPGAELVQVLWAPSACSSLEEAVADLAAREGTSRQRIGYLSFFNGLYRCEAAPEALEQIRSWAGSRSFDAVIWTDLPSNFSAKTNMPFSPDNAVTYLGALKKYSFEKAKEYLAKAPKQVSTPVRRQAEEILQWWL